LRLLLHLLRLPRLLRFFGLAGQKAGDLSRRKSRYSQCEN
jgi:hypothetical protein